jgi:polar amino acid transport system substrate-binding protein
MKWIIISRLKMIKLLIPLILLSSFLYSDVVIAYDTQSIGDPKKATPHQKIEIEKIKKIASKSNIKVSFEAVPWKRSLLMVEKGMIDRVIQASYKANRAKYANYPMKDGKADSSKRLNDGNSYYIYRHIDSALKWDGKTFSNSGIVAAMDKFAVIEDLKKHPNITIKTYTNNSEIIRKLASAQIDAYAGSAKITDDLLKRFPNLAKNIIRESLPIRKKDYFLIFSKITYKEKSKEMEKIWLGLQEFNEKNRLD